MYGDNEMSEEFIVTSSAAPGIGALKAHYPTAEAAIRFAYVLLEEGSPLVRIVDSDGNAIMGDDDMWVRKAIIARNLCDIDRISGELHNLALHVNYVEINKSEDNAMLEQYLNKLEKCVNQIVNLLIERAKI